MLASFAYNIPGFSATHNLGADGVIDRYSGKYQGKPAMILLFRDEKNLAVASSQLFNELNPAYQRISGSQTAEERAQIRLPGMQSITVGSPPIVLFLIEGVTGQTLTDAAERRWSPLLATRLIEQLGHFLRHAHAQRLFHGALAPDKLQLVSATSKTEDQLPSLILNGLGLAAIEVSYYRETGESVTHTAEELSYRAPELREAGRPPDEACDVFSLAKLWRRLVLGSPKAAFEKNETILSGLRELIDAMDQTRPDQRPSLADVEERLAAFVRPKGQVETVEVIHKLAGWTLSRGRSQNSGEHGWLRTTLNALQESQVLGLQAAKQLSEQNLVPGLVPVLTVQQPDSGGTEIFSQNLGSQTLRQYVEAREPLGIVGLAVIEQIARIIVDFQQHIGHHLGICPETILINERPDGSPQAFLLLSENVQVLRTLQGTRRTLAEQGTLRPSVDLNSFLAPEQFTTQGGTLSRADVFGLGSLLYFVLTKRVPPRPGHDSLPSDTPRLHADLVPNVNGVISCLRNEYSMHRPEAREAARIFAWLLALDKILRGEILRERYRFKRPLQAGGMSVPLVMTEVARPRDLVMKIPLPQFPISRTEQERDCAQRAHNAAPDSVVIVEEIGELADGIPYLTMEYLDGMPLSSRLERMRHRKERMREHEVARIGLLVACAMDKVHKAGVIHRDLKPENLMLVPSGGAGTKANFVPERIKILDFGIAVDVSRQQSGQPRLTSIGSLMGTWAYMPPEQVDATQVTAKADVHALGCILYELLGGHLPIVRPLKSVLCSPRMTELLTRMTAQVAADRPTMGLVVPRLEELSRNRNRTSLAPILLIALVVLAIGLLLTFIITS